MSRLNQTLTKDQLKALLQNRDSASNKALASLLLSLRQHHAESLIYETLPAEIASLQGIVKLLDELILLIEHPATFKDMVGLD